MHRDDWAQLPKELQDFIWTDITDINDDLLYKYDLKFDQLQFINIVEDKVILKKISALDVAKEMESMPRSDTLDLRVRLILRLGGKVPKTKPLRKSKSTDHEFVDSAEGSVRKLLEKYKTFGDERISSKKIINKEGRKVTPNINNWLKDYVHFLGAGDHSSLQRAKYLSKSNNALSISPVDRANLRFLLISYDDGTEYSFEKNNSLLKIKALKKAKQNEDLNVKKTVSVYLTELQQNIKDLEKKLIPGEFLLSEADGNLSKVNALLWDSLGLVDKEKTISCLRLMLEKKSFDSSIKEDKRFVGIMKRFLNIKYGKKLDIFLANNTDKLMLKRLFLEMVLVEKLKFKNQEALLVAFYLTNLISESGQVVFLDKGDLSLKWREVHVVGDNIAWLNEIK